MPIQDNHLRDLFNINVRQASEWPGMRCEALPDLVRFLGLDADSDASYISWSQLTPDTADAAIERQVSFFRGRSSRFEWVVHTHDQPPDLGARLEAHGFVKSDDPGSDMVVDLDDLPQEIWNLDTSMIRRVTTPEEIDAVIAMENEVWKMDLSRVGRSLKRDLEKTPERVSILAIFKGTQVVSAAWSFYLVPEVFVGLYGGSTGAEYRHRGYYHGLLTARAREALERGYRYLYVDAGPESQPILSSLGFQCLGVATCYDWKPEPEQVH